MSTGTLSLSSATLPDSPSVGWNAEIDFANADPRICRQQALVAFGRRTSAQPELAVLMNDAVTLIGEVLETDLGSVGMVEGTTLSLSVSRRQGKGCVGTPQDHCCQLGDTNSTGAYALRTGSLTVSPDLAADRRFHDDFLHGLGIAGAMVIPLHLNGRPYGVLGVYTTRPRQFTLDDVTFAETIAHLLSTSIARIKVEQKLREVHAIKSGVLEMLDAMVMTLDMDGRIVDMNRACEELTRYRSDEIRDRTIWGALSSPEEAEILKSIFRGSRGDNVPSQFEGDLVAKDGTRRRVCWSLKVLSTGQVQTILMTGTDTSAHAETKAELERIRALAEQTTATLAQLCSRFGEPRTANPPAPSAPSGATPTAEVNPIDAVAELAGAELRRNPRRAYRYRQPIAPMINGMTPAPKQFFEVDCWDISVSGVSFLLDHVPDFDTLVVALGRAPTQSHFTARVVRVARMEHDGQRCYLIGCSFLGRIHV